MNRRIELPGTDWYIIARDEGTIIVYEIMRDDDILFEGAIKWDGCSNWTTDCFHSCDQQCLFRLGEAMAICWNDAKNNIVCWEGQEVFGQPPPLPPTGIYIADLE